MSNSVNFSSSNKVPFFTSEHQLSRYGDEITQAICEVMKGGQFILGPQVKKFEESLAEYCGVKHAIGVANASDALFLLVQAAGLPEGSEVLTTPYTFFASASCLVRNGLKPIFIDVDRTTFHITAQDLKKHITPNTKAVLSVDLFSHCCNNEEIKEFCDDHNLLFIEDSAEAFGMKWNGEHAGSKALGGVLSFFPTKTLGCFGDGGAIITNNDRIADMCRVNRVHGARKKYVHETVGINSRLDELQAAVLNIKLKYVNNEIKERESLVVEYVSGLCGIDQIQLPATPPQATPVWYVFAPLFQERDALAEHLASMNIGTSVYWPKPLHTQECFQNLGQASKELRNAEYLCRHSLALPLFSGMNTQQVHQVVSGIRSFYS